MSDIVEVQEVSAPESDPVEDATAALKERFPEYVADDTRDRYTGLVVDVERLTEIGKYVRDDLGFNYLSSVTGVDLIEENKMEVVYHAFSTEKGGGPVVLKVQVDRDDPKVPSLVPIWPGASFNPSASWSCL